MGVEYGTGHKSGDPLDQKDVASMSQKKDEDPAAVPEDQPDQPDQPDTSDLDLACESDQDYDECVNYHEGRVLYAEDVDGQLAVLPEFSVTTGDVMIEDIQLEMCPAAARGVVCDIDVGEARPTALECRKLRIQFREKLAELIKGLLSAKMINHSRSPWPSPIVVIIKKNADGLPDAADQRSTGGSGIYTMVLLTGYGEWFLSGEDDGSGSPDLGLYHPIWTFRVESVPFGLKNAPHIYQQMIDNALYGFTRIPKLAGGLERLDVFEAGEPEDPANHRC
ncbi:reverse transcriptase [Phytophthora megakarya]|uniref:Reverse transcriptase n=1 Tax=Phytophthora megakarya TaxID=4795 RepID=A0A225VKB3_9STRA|nr:reverse transcriptase [Phytophthora megakarya]